MKRTLRFSLSMVALAVLAACSGSGQNPNSPDSYTQSAKAQEPRETTIWDAFRGSNEETTLKVNKYIWTAALEILDFLPIQSVDPFSGVIVTGYGTPPGGSKAYRATIFVRDPALDARSLNIAMQYRNGRSVSDDTIRAVEDAILARARQLRIRDGRF